MVAPNNGSRFSADSFAFAQDHLNVVDMLLGSDTAGADGIAAGDAPGTVDHLGHRLWAKGNGGTIALDPAGAAHEHAGSTGIQAGFDIGAGPGRLGVAVGYTSQSLNDFAGGRGHDDETLVSIYGSVPLSQVGLEGVVSYAHGINTTDRATGIGNAHARRGLDDVLGAVQLTAPLSIGRMTVTPALGISVSSLSSEAFAETFALSPAFAVSGHGRTFTSVSPYATFNLSRVFTTSGGVAITPFALAGYRYNDGAAGQIVTLTAADGTLFTGNRVGVDKSSAVVGVSLSAGAGPWRLSVQYRGTSLGGGWSNQASLGARLAL